VYDDSLLDGLDNSRKLHAVLGGNFERWRSQLGSFNWDDNHHKSNDINVARMRAKYFDAKYIIHRRTLAHALYHLSGNTPRNQPSESLMGAPSSRQPSPAMTQPAVNSRHKRAGFEMRLILRVQELEPWMKESAKACVEAAIRSTTSFDAVKERLIITNIFGTAHTQFGKIIVLAATFRSDLGYLVDGQTLKDLLHRTIKFLEFSKNISPTLVQDADVLKQVREVFFREPDYQPQSTSTTSSFA
jgi:hypothetical protein